MISCGAKLRDLIFVASVYVGSIQSSKGRANSEDGIGYDGNCSTGGVMAGNLHDPSQSAEASCFRLTWFLWLLVSDFLANVLSATCDCIGGNSDT